MLRLASRAAMRAAAVSSGLASRGAARTCSKKAPMLGLMSGFHTSSFRKALSPVGDSDFETGGVGVDMSKEPSMDEAKSMVRSYSEMSNESLLVLASIGDHDAHAERLRREIMAVDKCSYAEACLKLSEIDDANNQYMGALTLPYKLGIATFMVTGVGSIPMVFSLDLATWFNAEYVTADVPEPKDLETWLGSWSVDMELDGACARNTELRPSRVPVHP